MSANDTKDALSVAALPFFSLVSTAEVASAGVSLNSITAGAITSPSACAIIFCATDCNVACSVLVSKRERDCASNTFADAISAFLAAVAAYSAFSLIGFNSALIALSTSDLIFFSIFLLF